MSSLVSSSASSSSASDSEASSARTPLKRKRNAINRSNEESESEHEDDADTDEEAASDSETSDVPVLSHAEKRRRKKKQKLESSDLKSKSEARTNQAADSSRKKTADKAGAAAAPPQRQNSVWVGNLSYTTTPQSIREFFKDVGEITRVHMPVKAAKGPGGAKENRGFAYVDFASPDAKVIAITLSEQEWEGRRLLIKDGDDFTGRPAPASSLNADTTTSKDPTGPGSTNTSSRTAQKILASQKQPPAPTLFLGNLSFESTEQSIREMLEAHRGVDSKNADKDQDKGKDKDKDVWIRKIRLGTFEDSGHCKGWAFVDFTSIKHATAVLTNPRNHHLDGRKLVVEYASPDAVRRGGGGLGHLGKEKYSKEGRELKKRVKESLPKRRDSRSKPEQGGDGADEDQAEQPQPASPK